MQIHNMGATKLYLIYVRATGERILRQLISEVKNELLKSSNMFYLLILFPFGSTRISLW